MDYNVITAEEARNNSYKYIKTEYEQVIKYIMSKISDASKKGKTNIALIEIDLYRKEFTQIVEIFNKLISSFEDKTFHEYLHHLGFATSFEVITRHSNSFDRYWEFDTKKFTISW